MRRRVLALAAALLIITAATALVLARPWERAPAPGAVGELPHELATGNAIAVPTADDAPPSADAPAPVSPAAAVRPGAEVVLTDSIVATLRTPVEGDLVGTIENVDRTASRLTIRVESFAATHRVSKTQAPARLVWPKGSLVSAGWEPAAFSGDDAANLRSGAALRARVRIASERGRTVVTIMSLTMKEGGS